MQTYAVVKVGGKQYVVSEGDQLIVERLHSDVNSTVELPVLMTFDGEGTNVKIGAPELTGTVKAEVLEHMKGDKIRIAKFKAKVRYRKVQGFRPYLSKIKITQI